MSQFDICNNRVDVEVVKEMAITLDPKSDLTEEDVMGLLDMIDTPDKRRRVLGDLYTLCQNLEGLFIFEDSPFRGQKSHPLYKIMVTANEFIGSLFKTDEDLVYHPSKYGMVVEVRGRNV